MNSRKTRIKIFTAVVLTVILMAAGFFAFLKVNDAVIVKREAYMEAFDIANNWEKFHHIRRTIDEKYLYGEVSEKDQVENACKSLFMDLDEYSRYLTEKDMKEMRDQMNSVFTGIGVVVAQKDNGDITVRAVIKDGPAESAGIRKGDIIKTIGGKKYESSEEAAEAIRGKVGSTIDICVLRDKSEKNFKVVRGDIELSTVESAESDSGCGYIRIKSFGDKTSEDFIKAMKNMENSHVSGVVIDLRQNGGGLFDEGIEVADYLLPECLITFTKERSGKKKEYRSDAAHTDLKYVLLVDEYTASSAEILAGAVKANGGGKLVGQKTFGKGVVQETEMFKDNTGICLTVMEYYDPKGRRIQGKGIVPDYVVKNDNWDFQLEKALEMVRK